MGVLVAVVSVSAGVGSLAEPPVLVFFGATTIAGALLAGWGFRRMPEGSNEGHAERAVLSVAAGAGGAATEADVVMKTALSAGEVRAAVDRLRTLGLIEAASGEGGGAYRIAGPARAAAEAGPASEGAPPAARMEAVSAQYGLTRGEANVLALVATGLTNDEIGEKLFVSSATVRTHLYNIFRKLGVRSRVQAALLVTRTAEATPRAGIERERG